MLAMLARRRAAQRALGVVSGAVRRALRLVQRAVDSGAPGLNRVGSDAAEISDPRLRLRLPLVEPFLKLRTRGVTTLRREQQTNNRANRATPDKRTNHLHFREILLKSCTTDTSVSAYPHEEHDLAMFMPCARDFQRTLRRGDPSRHIYTDISRAVTVMR